MCTTAWIPLLLGTGGQAKFEVNCRLKLKYAINVNAVYKDMLRERVCPWVFSTQHTVSWARRQHH